MAFTDLGSLGSNGSTSNNQGTLDLVTTASIAAGELVVVVVGADNIANGGDDNAVSGVTLGVGGQAFTKGKQVANALAAQAGASSSLWYCVAASAFSSGGTIRATFGSGTLVDASGITARHFSMAATFTAALEGTAGTLVSNTAADPGSLNVTTANIACLRVRGIASQVGNNTNLTPTASWTAWANGNSATTGTTAEICARAEHIISTATGAASDPTYVSAIYASVYVAFKEVSAVVSGDGNTAGAGGAATAQGQTLTIVSGDGSLSGAGAATAEGRSVVTAISSTAGGVGAATAEGEAVLPVAATRVVVSWVELEVVQFDSGASVGTASGAGAAAAGGAQIAGVAGQATGSGAATAEGRSIAGVAGSTALGISTANADGAKIGAVDGAAAGTGAANGAASSDAYVAGAGASAGVGAAAATALSFAGVTASAAGTGTAASGGAKIGSTPGAATGAGAATADTLRILIAAASGAGAGAASGAGGQIAAGAGSVSGQGVAAGVGSFFSLTYLYPDSDTTLDGWSDQTGGTSGIYAAIDETTASDTDYVQSPEIAPSTTSPVVEAAGLSTSGSGTVTLPSASAGDLVVVLTLGYSLVFNPTYTSANLTFTQEFYTAFEGAVSWAVAAGTLTNEVITPSTGTIYNTIALAISGADTADPFDGVVESDNSTTPQAKTTTETNTLVIGTMGQNATGTSGWATAINGNYMAAVTQEAVSAGSYTPSFSAGGEPTTTLAIRPASALMMGRSAGDFKVRLFEGATQIAEWTHIGVAETFTDVVQTLTAPQFAAITNFANLSVEFDDDVGNVYRFTLGNPPGLVIEPVKIKYRLKKLAA